MEVSSPKEGTGYELRAPALVRLLRRRGPTARQVLAHEMGIPANTVWNTANLLSGQNVLFTGIGRGGREQLWLHPDLGILVGVTVSHRRAAVAISRFDFNLLNDVERAQCEIQVEDPEASLRQIASLIARELATHFEEEVIGEKLIGIGLVVPGPIARERNPDPSEKEAAEWDRRVRAGFIMPGWDDVDLGARLATLLIERHGLKPPRYEERRVVWVENDASAGALGVHTEMRNNLALGVYDGQLQNLTDESIEDLIYVRISSGIGAGIINKGHLVTGARGFAGEIGHVAVDPGGALCISCGGRGCLETVASNRAVMEQLGVLFPNPRPPAGSLGDAAAAATASKDTALDLQHQLQRILASSHPAVDRALRGAGSHVGELLAKVCCLLNPSAIVFGGEMPEYRGLAGGGNGRGEETETRPFMLAAKEAICEHAIPQVSEGLVISSWSEVRHAEQTLSPEMLGALALVVDHLGDAYLLKPIARWIRTTESREQDLSFSEPCLVD